MLERIVVILNLNDLIIILAIIIFAFLDRCCASKKDDVCLAEDEIFQFGYTD